MAQRRMFSRKITESDQFLDMPMSSQVLYFHVNMQADDDGFVGNVKMIKRMIGASDDDLKILISKEYLIPFESGVVVIKDWKIHNYIRSDRYNETFYKYEKSLLELDSNNSYLVGIPDVIPEVDQRLPQVRLGKDRLGKGSKDISETSNKLPENELKSDFDKLWALYPNKKGKQKAYNAYKKAIKDGTSNKEIQNGIVSYTKEIEIKRTEPNFIAHGSTWFANQRWEDDYQTSLKPQAFGLPDAPDKFQVKQEDIDAFEQMMGRKVTSEELEAMKGG